MTIMQLTTWLREEQDLTAGRLAYLLRRQGVDPKTLICAKIFPDIKEPTGGVVITPEGLVYKFSFNRAGMIVEHAVIDEWINLTASFKDHPWRDDILDALTFLKRT